MMKTSHKFRPFGCLLGHDWVWEDTEYAKETEFPVKVVQRCRNCTEEREIWI